MTEEVNQIFLDSLIEMGIDQEIARKALKIVNNKSLEDALAIVFNESNQENIMTYKMLFVINGSLRMNSGKMSTQVAHCAIDLYQKLIEKNSKSLNYWHEYGETKIVVRGQTTEELIDIETRAKKTSSIVTSIIEDTGSITCVGLFGTNEQLNPITGHLKLMQDCLKCNGK